MQPDIFEILYPTFCPSVSVREKGLGTTEFKAQDSGLRLALVFINFLEKELALQL